MRGLLTICAAVALAGCALTPQKAQQMSSFEICDKIASPTQPAAGVSAGINELGRRGENCSQFADIFAERSNRSTANSMNSAAMVGAGAALLNSSRPAVVQPVVVQQDVIVPAPAPKFPRIGQ